MPSRAQAEIGNPPSPMVIEKGPHHRTWQVAHVSDIAGQPVTNYTSYVELQNGLHRFDPGLNVWVETDSPHIELFNDGAVVRNLQYSVIFNPNLAAPGAIDLSLPGGERLTGQIMGLAFTEGDQSVLIAETRDCAAEVGGAA